MESRRVACQAAPAGRRDSGCEGRLIRVFARLAGQLVAPPGPPASRLCLWAPRGLFSPRLARAIITDLIKMKPENGPRGGRARSPRG